MINKCFICEQNFNSPNIIVDERLRFLCTECAVFTFEFNRLDRSYDSSLWCISSDTKTHWKSNGGMQFWYDGYKKQLDNAKAAYKPTVISDWKCPECKIPMPHKVKGICVKCCVDKLLET